METVGLKKKKNLNEERQFQMLCCSIFGDHTTNKTVKRKRNGGVAQLGEHLPCKQGVMGSNPIISINQECGKATEGRMPQKRFVAQVVRARA